jgi:phage/plasmid-associated DNA primase
MKHKTRTSTNTLHEITSTARDLIFDKLRSEKEVILEWAVQQVLSLASHLTPFQAAVICENIFEEFDPAFAPDESPTNE